MTDCQSCSESQISLSEKAKSIILSKYPSAIHNVQKIKEENSCRVQWHKETEAGGSVSSMPVWSIQCVPRQPELHSETLSRDKKEKKTNSLIISVPK